MKKLLLMALVATFSLAATAQTTQPKKELKQDAKELRQDKKELHQDIKNGDKVAAHKEKQDIKNDRKDMRQDAKNAGIKHPRKHIRRRRHH